MFQNEGLAGEEQFIDVAIIGGGLAGLCAARELRRDGVDVVVFEANDRVGGHVLNKSIGRAPSLIAVVNGSDLNIPKFSNWPMSTALKPS